MDKHKLAAAINVMVKIILVADGAMCYRKTDSVLDAPRSTLYALR
ncbi:MAG: hypothetical protein ABIH24_04255 [Verrucomicrobiota bacterium]